MAMQPAVIEKMMNDTFGTRRRHVCVWVWDTGKWGEGSPSPHRIPSADGGLHPQWLLVTLVVMRLDHLLRD